MRLRPMFFPLERHTIGLRRLAVVGGGTRGSGRGAAGGARQAGPLTGSSCRRDPGGGRRRRPAAAVRGPVLVVPAHVEPHAAPPVPQRVLAGGADGPQQGVRPGERGGLGPPRAGPGAGCGVSPGGDGQERGRTAGRVRCRGPGSGVRGPCRRAPRPVRLGKEVRVRTALPCS